MSEIKDRIRVVELMIKQYERGGGYSSHAIKALEAQDQCTGLPENQEFVKDDLTWGDTEYNSNAVRYGMNLMHNIATPIIAKDKRTIAELQEELNWWHNLIHKHHDNEKCPNLKSYVEGLQEKITAQQEKIRGLEEELAEGVE